MTKIISAFPGTGKTHLFNNPGVLTVLDSDSSQFDKSGFPANYINHIKENIDEVDVILVSSHKEVREALVKEGIAFDLVLPHLELEGEYVSRYISRGSCDGFVSKIEKHWHEWICDCLMFAHKHERVNLVWLDAGEYLSDKYKVPTGETFEARTIELQLLSGHVIRGSVDLYEPNKVWRLLVAFHVWCVANTQVTDEEAAAMCRVSLPETAWLPKDHEMLVDLLNAARSGFAKLVSVEVPFLK